VADELTVRVEAAGVQLLLYRPEPQRDDATVPDAATEPPLPQDVASADELYLTGTAWYCLVLLPFGCCAVMAAACS
jgi:hypothetical protein